jgi:hypothetical protein
MPKRTRKYATGLNLVPVSDVSNNGYESPRQLSQRLRKEDADQKAAAQRAAELADPMYQAEETFKQAVYSQAIAYGKRIAKMYSQNISDLESAVRYSEALADDLGLSTTENSQRDSFDGILQRFVDGLPKMGVTLTANGPRRFALFVYVQITELKTALTDDNLKVLLNRLISVGAFADGEVIGEFPRAKKQATEKPEPTFDDIAATLSTQSDEGNKALKIAAVHAALTGPIREMWSAFTASLYQNFNGFVLTDAQGLTFYRAMVERRANFLRPQDYDAVRVSLTQSGDLPAHLRYPREQMVIDLENANLADPAVRRTFNQRERQLAGR